MTQKFTAGALLIAVASALTLLRAQEIVVPDTSTLVRMTARFAPTEIGADLSKLSAADRRVARQAGRGGEDRRRVVPPAGVVGQRGDAARPGARRFARRPRAAALFPDQQGAVVAARSQPAVRPRRAAEAGGRQLLSGRRDESGTRTLDAVAVRGRTDACHRVLHGDSPRRRRASRSCPTASSTRTSWRAAGVPAARSGGARRPIPRSRTF